VDFGLLGFDGFDHIEVGGGYVGGTISAWKL
jgi:hypothetical protein